MKEKEEVIQKEASGADKSEHSRHDIGHCCCGAAHNAEKGISEEKGHSQKSNCDCTHEHSADTPDRAEVKPDEKCSCGHCHNEEPSHKEVHRHSAGDSCCERDSSADGTLRGLDEIACCGCGHDHGHGHQHGEESGKKEKFLFFARVFVSVLLLALGAFLPVPTLWKLAFFIPSYLIIGADVVFGGVKGILKGKMLDERLLMTIASIGAFLVGEAPEGVLVMLLYQIGEFLTDLSLARSKKSISALTKLRPEIANVIRNGLELTVNPQDVAIDEVIVVRPGERIPLDGRIVRGSSSLDTSALTGESVPVGVKEGQDILSGSVNLQGLLEIKVTKSFGQSAVMRILDMVSDAAEKKTKTEQFIKKFAKYYTPAVVLAAVIIAVLPPLILGGQWVRFIQTALLFLVISCPCALVIAVPLTYFAGVGGASKKGILVKGGNAFDALKKVKTVVFDKTGTLTEGVFQVTSVSPAEGVDKDRLVRAVSAAEANSNHPIAKSIVSGFQLTDASVADFQELSGRGISALVDGKKVLAGNAKLMQENDVSFNEVKSAGSVVYVAEGQTYLGAVVVSDKVKSGAIDAISALKKAKISTVMLTGDREASAKETAEVLGLDGYRAALLPGDKVSELEKILQSSSAAFVGDGVNDAPVLTRADVGIAMGALGQDAAIEAADVVIMDDKPEKVALSIKIAKRTGRIAMQNIIFALAVKAVVMALGLCGIANMWLAVFADVGVTLLAIVNALRAFR